jgi:hypothetical protein
LDLLKEALFILLIESLGNITEAQKRLDLLKEALFILLIAFTAAEQKLDSVRQKMGNMLKVQHVELLPLIYFYFRNR